MPHHRLPPPFALPLALPQIFWLLGTTPLLVSSLTVLILLFASDILFVPRHGKGHGSAASGSRASAARLDAPSPAAAAVGGYPAAPPV